MDIRYHYHPLPLGCSVCGELVRPTLEPPKLHHFLCPCENYWDKLCFGTETEPCLACGFQVVPRASPPTTWHMWCMCGHRTTQLSYKPPAFSCPGKRCRETVQGRGDVPAPLYYKCNSCNSYYKDLGYPDVPQPCTGCPAKIWPTNVPESQHYLCEKCGMYFALRSDPDEVLQCRRQSCSRTLAPSLLRPEAVYLRQGQFVAPVPVEAGAPHRPCYFLCNCGALEGDYWYERSWNPTEPQYCEGCRCEVYPAPQPLPHRQHTAYFLCKCGAKWLSDNAYSGVAQTCKGCLNSVKPAHIEPRTTRGIVV